MIQPVIITFLSLPINQKQPIEKTPGRGEPSKITVKSQRTFQRAIFKLSSWHFKLYYANCNLFSSFFLGNDIFHLTTLCEGVLPSFWKAPTLSPVSHDIICPCLTAHMCSHWCSRDSQQIRGCETGSKGEQPLLYGGWLWKHLCLTGRMAYSERK